MTWGQHGMMMSWCAKLKFINHQFHWSNKANYTGSEKGLQKLWLKKTQINSTIVKLKQSNGSMSVKISKSNHCKHQIYKLTHAQSTKKIQNKTRKAKKWTLRFPFNRYKAARAVASKEHREISWTFQKHCANSHKDINQSSTTGMPPVPLVKTDLNQHKQCSTQNPNLNKLKQTHTFYTTQFHMDMHFLASDVFSLSEVEV